MEKKPRPYGNGSLYKTSDNRWVVKVSLGSGPDGKPITKRFSARTKAEAEQKLRSFKNEQRKHDMLSPFNSPFRTTSNTGSKPTSSRN